MRILYFTSSGAPTGLYGGSVALLNLIRGVIKDEKNIVAAVFPEKGVLSEELEKLEVKCYYIFRYTLTTNPSPNNLRDFIESPLRYIMMLIRRYMAARDFIDVLDDFKPEIIHTNVGPLDTINNIAKKRKIPHVWHIREYQDLDFGMRFFPSKKKFMIKIHDKNNHLIAITNGIFDHFKMKKTDKVIYDGVFDKKSFRNIVPKKDYFLFVGSIKEAKGVKLLLQAYKNYIKNKGKYKLIIIGDGGPIEYKRECIDFVIENNLENLVTFLGFRQDVYTYMQEAIAMIVPSRFEGFGFITAEAMYNNCLVIGKNSGGTKEQFDNGCKMFNREIGYRFDNIEELTDCLLEVDSKFSNNCFNDQMLKDAFETSNTLYNNQNHVQAIIEYYQEIIGIKENQNLQ